MAHRSRMWCWILLTLLLGLGCGGGEEEKKPWHPGFGGVLEVGGDKLQRPPGSGVESFVAVPAPEEPTNRNLVRVSQAYTIASDGAVFRKPVTLTLLLDRSRLRPDLTPEEVHPVLASGGLVERLRRNVTVDLAAGTVAYELDRLYPLVAAEGASGAAETTTYVVIDGKKLARIGNSAEPTLYANEAHATEAAPYAEPVLKHLASARDKIERLGFPRVAPLRIEIADLKTGIAGQASGGDLIELNFATLRDQPFFTEALLAHEYFHSVQQQLLKNAWAKYPSVSSNFTPTDARWVDEGTADAIEHALGILPAAQALHRLKLNFGYRRLNAYDGAKDEIHEYQAAAFFLYVHSRYGDLRPVLDQYYAGLFSAEGPPPPPPDLSLPPDSLEALLQEEAILDAFKADAYRAMNAALVSHHKKSLRRLFLESLMALYVRKDIEPFTSGAAAVFGGPMELRVPDGELVKINCPYRVGDSWTGEQEMAPQAGEGMSIVCAVEITRMKIPEEQEGAALQLSLACANAKNRNDVIMIAFPVGDDGKVRPHSVGNLERPAAVADWNQFPKAIVWLVNTTAEPRDGIRLKALVKAGSELKLGFQDGRRDTEGNTLVVASPALGRLDEKDKRNGLRFVLYRATAASGPFEKVTSNWLDENVKVDVVKGDPRSKELLLAADKVAIGDPNVYRDDQKPQSGPFWYRVGQSLLLDGKPTGEENFSNVIGPGEGQIRINPGGGGEETRVDGQWCVFEAALSATNQNWDCPGADFTVRCGGWTGHFRSGRREEGKTFGSVRDSYLTIGAAARLRAPYRPGGGEITIEAQGRGLSATRTVKMPEDAALAAKEREALTRLDAAKEQVAGSAGKQAEEARKLLAEAEKGLADYLEAVRNKQVVFGSVPEIRRQILRRKFDLDRVEKVSLAYADAQAFDSLHYTFQTIDPSFELKQRQRMGQRLDAEQALDIEQTTAEIELLGSLAGEATDDSARRQIEEARTFLAKQVMEMLARPPNSRYQHVGMIEPAERAGIAADVRRGYETKLAVIDEQAKAMPQTADRAKYERADLLRKMAESLAMLTGNRSEAADLWEQADKLAGPVPTGKKDLIWLPAWWPE